MGERFQLDRKALLAIVPHRPPSLLLDGVLRGDAESVLALKSVGADEPFFAGHFPGRPLMPGALVVEAMAQACLVLYHFNFPVEGLLYLARAKARFRAPVGPGDRLEIEARRIKVVRGMGLAACRARVGEKSVAEAELGFSGAKNPVES